VQIEFLDAYEPDRQRLLPGQTFEQMFPLLNPSEPFQISVLAVKFDDKSNDGDAQSVKEMLDVRPGFTKGMKRLKPLLEAALDSPEGDSPAIWIN
jgi:hypothetical protein